MKLNEKKLKSELIYNGKIINVRRDEVLLENNSKAIREVVEHSGGVCIVAITDNNEILLVRQFRYPQGRAILEIPAGKLEVGEEPIKCGMRELNEETGYFTDKFIYLGHMLPTPAYDTEKIFMYQATNLREGKQKLDKDEFLEVVKVPFEEAIQMIMVGEIDDAKTCLAILKSYYLKFNTEIK